MGDLLRRQPAVQSEARHVGARGEGVGVVDLVVGVFDDLVAGAAQLAEVLQARADGAVGDFLLGQLVAGVAVAAAQAARRIGLYTLNIVARSITAMISQISGVLKPSSCKASKSASSRQLALETTLMAKSTTVR